MYTQILGSNTQVIEDTSSELEERFTGGLLQKGEAIEEWIIESKLNVNSGEADIYIASKEGEKRIIKYYRGDAKPKIKVLETLKTINHPNIIKLYSYGEYKGHFYEIMEYAKGGALDSRDEKGNYKYLPLSEDKVIEICRKLLEAYKEIHNNKIIQRDIKPANIYFTDEEKSNVVIADFGISSFKNEADTEVIHRTSTGSRTTGYSAPEVLTGLISPKMDYYSLGITLWEIATGKDPFVLPSGKRRNDAHLIRDTIEGRIADDLLSREPFLSENLQRLIRGLLVINDKKRWGYDEVTKHLNGEYVEIAKKEKKFWSYKIENTTCTTLEDLGNAIAENIDNENVVKIIYRGNLSGYLEDYYPDVVKKLDEIIEEHSSVKDYKGGMLKIVWILNPNYPLIINNIYRAENIEDLVNLIINVPEEMIKLVKDRKSIFYNYLELFEPKDKINEIWMAVKDINTQYGWHVMERLYWVAIILKDKKIKPFKMERYKDFELTELKQLNTIPKDLRNYTLTLIKEGCLDGLFLPWITLLSDKDIDFELVSSWDDLKKILRL